MSKERRIHNRLEVNWPARIGNPGLGIAAARVKDASIGGAYLVTTLDVALGENVTVGLDIPQSKKISLIQSKVARKEKLNNGKLFGYGVQFLKLDDAVLGQLLRLCSGPRAESRPADNS